MSNRFETEYLYNICLRSVEKPFSVLLIPFVTSSARVEHLTSFMFLNHSKCESYKWESVSYKTKREPPKKFSKCFSGASCRIRTNDPEITNHVLWPTELWRRVEKLTASRRYNQLPLLRSSPGGVPREHAVQDLPVFCGKGTTIFWFGQVFSEKYSIY